MSEQVAARIRELIEREGPIGFDRYMEHALYGPGGFFHDHPVGADAHFVTAPHVHPFVFARCLRGAIAGCWQGLGEPEPLRLVELGAGDGTLAAALLEAFAELPSPEIDLIAVEVSPGGRSRLEERGIDRAERIDRIAPFEGVALANELLDNLPFLLASGTPDGPREVRIGLRQGRFERVAVPWSDPRVDPAELHLTPGAEMAVPVGAEALLDALSERLTRGYALLVDYGARDGGGVHGYRQHRLTEDVLADPGGTDITAGVDPDLVAAMAQRRGFGAWGPIRQADALETLGYRRWDDTMRERQAALQREGAGGEAVRVWETRSRASLLVEPSGLGAHWWLVLAAGELPEPAWVADAGLRAAD